MKNSGYSYWIETDRMENSGLERQGWKNRFEIRSQFKYYAHLYHWMAVKSEAVLVHEALKHIEYDTSSPQFNISVIDEHVGHCLKAFFPCAMHITYRSISQFPILFSVVVVVFFQFTSSLRSALVSSLFVKFYEIFIFPSYE